MTEEGYLGNDPLLLDAMDSIRTQETVDFFYEASMGQRRLTGAMANRIKKHIQELKALTVGRPADDAKHVVQQWITTHDIRIHFFTHGKCLISLNPADSKCNQLGKTESWRNTTPNYNNLSPDICMGCSCHAIDTQHSDFWQHRYVENMQSWLQAKYLGIEADYKISQIRAKQAKQILTALGAPIPTVDLDPE